MLKDNNHFKIKVKSLLEENEELREKLEQRESHQNALIRSNSKALSEYSAKIAALESEKESLKHQNDNFYKESVVNNESVATNVRKIHDLERENKKFQMQLDEVKTDCRKEIANVKIEMQNRINENNRARELLMNQIEDLKTKYEIAENKINSQKRQIEEKEREILKSVNSANEENWIKINELTNEKLDLESKLQILQRDLDYKSNLLQTDKEKFDEILRSLEKHRDEAYKENNRLRAIINDNENVRNLLEKEQEKNRDLAKKCHKLEVELSTNTGLEQELTESNMKLRNELSFYVQEMQKSKEHIHRMKEEYEIRLSDMKAQYISEKNEYQIRYNEVQAKYDKLSLKMSELTQYHDRKKKQYQGIMNKIKTKSELLNTRIKEFKLKEQQLSSQVPLETYNKVKQQLNNLLRRQQEFRDVLSLNEPQTFPTKEYATTLTVPAYKPIAVYTSSNNFPNSIELDAITSRIDKLTQNQSEHLNKKRLNSPKPRIRFEDMTMPESSQSFMKQLGKKNHQEEEIKHSHNTSTASSDDSLERSIAKNAASPIKVETKLVAEREKDKTPIDLNKSNSSMSSSSSSDASSIASTKAVKDDHKAISNKGDRKAMESASESSSSDDDGDFKKGKSGSGAKKLTYDDDFESDSH